ncbi:MAG: DUF6106 family protein [Clostridiales bacterium]|nr:DUF6106 family protein [Clostridiales bacterium]MCD8371408.1 DUF6106 family protein [Clostridiales bacterium]
MNDTYVEHLIQRKTPFYTYIVTGILGLVTAAFVLLALTVSPISIILMLVFGVLTYLSWRNAHVEYEYLYVDRSLTIDAILGRAKRKKAFECSVSELEIMAPTGNYMLDNYRNVTKTADYTSQREGAKTYTMIVQKDGNTSRILLEPNEKILQCMRQLSPGKVVL